MLEVGNNGIPIVKCYNFYKWTITQYSKCDFSMLFIIRRLQQMQLYGSKLMRLSLSECKFIGQHICIIEKVESLVSGVVVEILYV